MLPLPISPGSSPQQYVRRFARHRCSRTMQVRFRRDNEERLVKGRCNVVSEGGFGALVPDDLPIGRMVTIEFSLEGLRDPIPLSARVLNHHGFSYGFEFVAPSPLQRNVIADFFYEELHSEPAG
jgi:PilZ domain.